MHYFVYVRAGNAASSQPSSVEGWVMEKYSSAAWILAFLGCFGAFLRALPNLFKIWIESGGDLRKDLFKRITELETLVAEERELCDRKLSRMQGRIDEITKLLTGTSMVDPAPDIPPDWTPLVEKLNKIDY